VIHCLAMRYPMCMQCSDYILTRRAVLDARTTMMWTVCQCSIHAVWLKVKVDA